MDEKGTFFSPKMVHLVLVKKSFAANFTDARLLIVRQMNSQEMILKRNWRG